MNTRVTETRFAEIEKALMADPDAKAAFNLVGSRITQLRQMQMHELADQLDALVPKLADKASKMGVSVNKAASLLDLHLQQVFHAREQERQKAVEDAAKAN